jgi:hypothetical protein
MGSSRVVHADDLRNARLEMVFYVTLLITGVPVGAAAVPDEQVARY